MAHRHLHFPRHLRDHQLINERYMESIELVSEYLMFLVALRPHMLPGFVLRSLLETTCDSLGTVWNQAHQGHGRASSSTTSSGKEKLAQILYNKILGCGQGQNPSYLGWNPTGPYTAKAYSAEEPQAGEPGNIVGAHLRCVGG